MKPVAPVSRILGSDIVSYDMVVESTDGSVDAKEAVSTLVAVV